MSNGEFRITKLRSVAAKCGEKTCVGDGFGGDSDDGGQMTDDGGQKSEGRGEKTEYRRRDIRVRREAKQWAI